jgi:hypothetical protein
MEDRIKDAERIVKEMNESIELSKVEELIKDNKISFEHDSKQYRVRLLNLKEKEELDLLRRKKFGQLIKDKDILLEKDLIIQCKERGIDIDKSDEEFKNLEAEELDLQLKLGEALAKNEGDSIFQNYGEQIKEIRIKKQILNTRKTLLLAYSLENTLLNYTTQLITYLSLDILEGEDYKRMFSSLEEFQTYKDEQLIIKAGSYSIILQSF